MQPDEPSETRASRPRFEAGSTSLEPGTRVGEWIISRELGQGGMAVVYAAEHPVVGSRVAIKVMRGALAMEMNAAERFVREARVLSEIAHPNVIAVFGGGTLPDGRPYLVMERVQGAPLTDWITDGALVDKLGLLVQVCDGLEAAHARGVVHRDLKPDNIFVEDLGRGRKLVKLLDFGLARRDHAYDAYQHLTMTGMTLGTPAYLSPEQAGGKDLDHRTDIYSLGVVAFELLLGRLPFVADNAADLILMHVTELVCPPSFFWPDIPMELESILLRMLQKEPDARPTLDEIARTFADAARHASGEHPAAPDPAATRRPLPVVGSAPARTLPLPPRLALTPISLPKLELARPVRRPAERQPPPPARRGPFQRMLELALLVTAAVVPITAAMLLRGCF